MDGPELLAGKRWLAALLAPLLAAGCASFESVKPGTPAQQVQARVGAPAEVWRSSDGGEVWEYPLGPSGRQTYMIDLGPDRSVREVRQVLNDETFSRVRAGMSREDVRRLLGRPAQTTTFARKNEDVWSWRYLAQTTPMLFHVAFDRSTGTVRTTQKLEEIIFIDDSE